MIYLNKVLPIFVSPLGLVLILLILAIYRRRQSFVICAVIILYLASAPFTSYYLLRSIEGGAIKLMPEDAPKSDAVVVLGGMIDWVQTRSGVATEWGDPDRFWDGVALVKANRAPLLIFTGSKLPWQLGQETEGEVLKRYAQMLHVPGHRILLTDRVENTADEAKAVSRLFDSAPRRIILVTSAFHMQRARSLFEQVGFDVFAYPVDFRAANQLDGWTAFLPSASALSTTDFCLREWFGRMYYRIKFYLSERYV
jgi:uncharacterized SAM-binding protein YcdF (DUF218 family)